MTTQTLTGLEPVKINLELDDEYLGDNEFQYDAAVISSQEIGQSEFVLYTSHCAPSAR